MMKKFVWFAAVVLLAASSLGLRGSSAADVVPLSERIVSADSVFKPNPDGVKRFAYVLMHYEGTERDDDYALALRVLVRSLQNSGTKHDIVVLASMNVRPHVLSQFADDGVKVAMVENIPNPYRGDEKRRVTYKAHFEFTFNKLYLWDMLQYERVVYLDSDNLALTNMDELFRCAHFCAEFMNQRNFHTGMLVVKPDHAKFLDMVDSLRSLPSYDGADQGFLTAYFHRLDDSPLFNPDSDEHTELPMARLPYGYNMNQVYFYERMSWRLQRGHKNKFSNLTIPAASLAYPITQNAKPWYWWPTFYFEMNFVWQAVRDQVDESDGTNWTAYFVSRILIYAVLYSLSKPLLVALQTTQHPTIARIRDSATRSFSRLMLWLGPRGPNIIGVPVGLFCAVQVGIFCACNPPWIHVLTPPRYAWYLFWLTHALLMYWCASIFSIIAQVPLPTITEIGPVMAWQVWIFLTLPLKIYPDFVSKAFVVAMYLFVWILMDVNIYRDIAYTSAARLGIPFIDLKRIANARNVVANAGSGSGSAKDADNNNSNNNTV